MQQVLIYSSDRGPHIDMGFLYLLSYYHGVLGLDCLLPIFLSGLESDDVSVCVCE